MKIEIFFLISYILLISCSDTKTGNCGKLPIGNNSVSVRIISVIPNPTGNDDYKESFTVKNFGSNPINLKGWKVIHKGKAVWDLTTVGELLPCREITIYNLNTESLDNNGDFLKLTDKDNILIHNIEWNQIPEGKEVLPR
jgi:hypothetical protein